MPDAAVVGGVKATAGALALVEVAEETQKVADGANSEPESRDNAPMRFHFTSTVGSPSGEEILHQRLSKARTLLRETGLSIEEIAVQCGFCHASYLSNLFRRETDMTP